MTPRIGDIVMVRGKGILARMIRQITGGHYNHAEIYVGQGEAVGAMQGEGIRICRLKDYLENGEEFCFVRVVVVSDREATKIACEALALKGTAYDTFGLLGIWFKLACKSLGVKGIVFWGKNKSADSRKFWCSELVGHLYGEQGIKFTQDDPSWLTPTEILGSPFSQSFGESNGPN